jgi:hypothetical protein
LSPARLPIPPRRHIKAVNGFEPMIKVLQTSALPLGYTAISIKKTGVAGFEPTNDGVKVRCLTAWLYPKKKGRSRGIEPPNVGATNRCVNHFATIAII